MPDLGILFNSPPLPLPLTPTLKPVSDQGDSSSALTPKPFQTLVIEGDCDLPLPVSNGNEVRVLRKARGGGKMTVENNSKCLDDYVKAWVENKVESGVAERKCFLPFLVSAPRLFRADNMACHLCKQKSFWRCVRCMVASHDKCAAFPEGVIHLNNQPGRAVCWRHPDDWRLEKHAAPTSSIEIEYVLFSPIVLSLTELDVYLIKKKRNDVDGDIGCTNCNSTQCSEDCVCRLVTGQTEFCGWGVEAGECINQGDFVIEYIGEVIDDAMCEQRLWDMKYRGVQNFYMCEIRKDFTIDATFKGNSSRFLNHSCDPNCKLEKWQVEGETRVGVFAGRSIKIGEPLTYDYRENMAFDIFDPYMPPYRHGREAFGLKRLSPTLCPAHDVTGRMALRPPGFSYWVDGLPGLAGPFVQFGPEVICHCAAPNCQGFLGTKRKIDKIDICWGSKRRRTPIITCLLRNQQTAIPESNLFQEA
ncbi:hypothetical protein RHSIM_Rhsim01G0021300 [Rhododendron simsii]|uniref:Uncharacterized protein n=1 Tax=Rhododendron simsii TaxID=118357 RepID=A0A834LVV5_RHOSS|nr:hypothetical protein RHSIM_Rhsim01G0021300 [Rhododendron simsii]